MKYVIPALSLLLASSTTLANPKPVTELLNGSDCQRNCISERKFGQTLLIVGRNAQGEEIGSFAATLPPNAVLMHSIDEKGPEQGAHTSVTLTRTYIAKPNIIKLTITQIYKNEQLVAIHGDSFPAPMDPKK